MSDHRIDAIPTEQEPMDGAHMSYLAERWATYHDDGSIRYEFESASDLAEFVRTFKPLPAEIEVRDEAIIASWNALVAKKMIDVKDIIELVRKFSTPKAETPRLTDAEINAIPIPHLSKCGPDGKSMHPDYCVSCAMSLMQLRYFARSIESKARGDVG